MAAKRGRLNLSQIELKTGKLYIIVPVSKPYSETEILFNNSFKRVALVTIPTYQLYFHNKIIGRFKLEEPFFVLEKSKVYDKDYLILQGNDAPSIGYLVFLTASMENNIPISENDCYLLEQMIT